MQRKQREQQKLVILGASLFAEEAADLVSEIEDYQLVGFVEGIDSKRCQQTLLGLPVMWIDDVAQLDDSYRGVCAVGTTRREKFIQQAVSLGLRFTTIVHPTAKVSRTALLGQGTIVSAGTVVAARTKIGCHVIINRGCLIGHHVEIGDYVTVSPGANIAGKVKIEQRAHIGMGAIILDGILVGGKSVVGAGAVVTRNVPNCMQVVGVPARVVKEINE